MRVSKRDPPKGIALSKVLLALAGLARAQHAYKLARYAYSKLQGLVLPPAVAADVELASLMLRACPFTDDDELLPICYRCQATNTLLNTQVSTPGMSPWPARHLWTWAYSIRRQPAMYVGHTATCCRPVIVLVADGNRC